jgi:HlyD family secretion protein
MQLSQWRGAGRWLAALAGLAIMVVAAGWYGSAPSKATAGHTPEFSQEAGTVSVEVMTPRPGGIDRVCLQPGTVEPFESADLYARVSGYLIEQKVDIGSAVRAGDVLAQIAVPEIETQVKQDTAEVTRARAKVDQVKAAITTAEADVGAARAAVALATAEKQSKTSYREYREKQRKRIAELVASRAIEAKLADEQHDQYQAAVGAESAATEAVGAAKQKEAAAKARVKQAEADLRFAEAEVTTAQAKLERAQVLRDFAVIRSPYTGVVTRRNFHPGDFIRSADAGGERLPLLSVERTDLMRVVIQVPDLDVPFVDRGDPAVIEMDALRGVSYRAEVSRLAASEDPRTRTMRTEVDVKNADGKLRRGMFGRVTLTLKAGAPEVLRIPSSALVGKADGGKGMVRVVREDRVAVVPVQYGTDNGSEVEVVTGLKATDRVILRASGPVEQGTPVTAANPT